MPKIVIIDDRNDYRITLRRLIDTHLVENWVSIDIEPLKKLEEYSDWLYQNEISIIILDERLHEQTDDIKYDGHDLVEYVRKHKPEIPIFIITSWPRDSELRKRFKDVEDIIPRKEFAKQANEYVPRIIRSGQKFYDTFYEELNKMSILSEKIAKGEANKEDIGNLQALRIKLNFGYQSETFIKNDALLEKLEKQLEELDNIKKEIEKKIN